MKITKKWFYASVFIILFTGIFSCAPKLSEESVKVLLEPVLKEDLAVIVEDIDSSGLLENPYFEIRELNKFDEGQYRYLAVADFYFLRGIKQKIVRKYRFNKIYLRWELFYNEYHSF